MFSTMPRCSKVLNPASATATAYSPMRTGGVRYWPRSSLSTSIAVLVARCVTVTVAPGMGAWESSRTVPTTTAVFDCCAHALAAMARTAESARRSGRMLFALRLRRHGDLDERSAFGLVVLCTDCPGDGESVLPEQIGCTSGA